LIVNNCSINIGYYDRHNEIWYAVGPNRRGEEWIDNITYWMPLPKNPHKEDEK